MIHLDTNVAVALLNGRPRQVRERFDEARNAGTQLGLSVIVYHELMYGAAASERRHANEEKIALFIASGGISLIDFNEGDAQEAADIRAQGTPIGPYDVLIAAQARRAGTVLVTANTGEFVRVPGLQVLDWAAAS
ncbi:MULTISPECIES: type II toxin-antitoxin system VapC family toxin [Rhizobium]|uniref:type II toxin-antitoxin system VapC family toxin n=1 Tax=Rhizobium TaxID=379 RepID=UPI00234F575B|nr:type II toxin-antitoxin system VapC family toxin [Rhizobium sp. BC56]MDC7744251.1 type II toxin-antitoxin system VapC family toxin [Rhizobium sp. BC56]